MKNLFIEPPAISQFGNQRIMGGFGANKADFAWPPLDLMTISGCLKHNGFDSAIYDLNNTKKKFQDIYQIIKKEKPRMVVFSTSITTIYDDLKIANIVKEISKDIITVAIGVHVMGIPKEILKYNKNLDVAVYNEPELVILNLIKNKYNPTNVLGICYRDKYGRIQQNAAQPNIENLEDLGMPSHDKIPIHIYRNPVAKRQPLAIIMANRGCVGQCTFCCQPYFWGKYRTRSVKHVIQELKWIQQLGYREVFWNDARLTSNLKWTHELMDEMIKNKIDLTWSCNDHANGLSRDLELLKKMKKAGCYIIHIGMESANHQILKNIKKGITLDQVRSAITMVKSVGIETMLFLILGLPGETKKTMTETIEFAKSVDVDYITLGIAQPCLGTPFYDYLVQNKYLKTRDWNQYDPSKPPVYDYPHLSSEEIFQAHYEGLRSFYLRPSYILKRALKIRSFHDLKSNFKNFVGFIHRYVWLNRPIKK